MYFKKRLSSFVSLHGVDTPNQLYHLKDPTKSTEERHEVGIPKSEALLVTECQMRRNEYPHKRQRGATGCAHAGCLKCGDTHQNPIFLLS